MIVEEMIKVQEQKELTDEQFAESLGIHRVSWYRNKRTGVVGADILLKAFEVYPELRVTFLSSFTHYSPPENAQNDHRATPWALLVSHIKGLFGRGK